MIEAVVAVYADWGIGADGTQPVVVRADRRHFRAVTDGAAVLVGRRTLADFPGGRPLKGRVNLVMTRQELDIEGARIVHSPAQALELSRQFDRLIVIGGASVYREMFPYLERIYVTKLSCTPRSDVFFPDLDADPAWRVTEYGELQEEDGILFRFLTYQRA